MEASWSVNLQSANKPRNKNPGKKQQKLRRLKEETLSWTNHDCTGFVTTLRLTVLGGLCNPSVLIIYHTNLQSAAHFLWGAFPDCYQYRKKTKARHMYMVLTPILRWFPTNNSFLIFFGYPVLNSAWFFSTHFQISYATRLPLEVRSDWQNIV